jgi:hypothetical protein
MTFDQELLNTRKPPGALSTELGATAMQGPRAAERPAEPARWVMDDAWGAVFKGWQLGRRCHQQNDTQMR